VFALGFLVRRANGTGAFWGVIAGMLAVVYVSWFTNVAWLYLNAVGPVVVIIVGTLVSVFTSRTTAGASAGR
jgi:SSS family solute:Na+ symporter